MNDIAHTVFVTVHNSQARSIAPAICDAEQRSPTHYIREVVTSLNRQAAVSCVECQEPCVVARWVECSAERGDTMNRDARIATHVKM